MSIAVSYSPVCTVVADTSSIPDSETSQLSAAGVKYYRKEFDIILLFGMTELKAQIAWTENVSLMCIEEYTFTKLTISRVLRSGAFIFAGFHSICDVDGQAGAPQPLFTIAWWKLMPNACADAVIALTNR